MEDFGHQKSQKERSRNRLPYSDFSPPFSYDELRMPLHKIDALIKSLKEEKPHYDAAGDKERADEISELIGRYELLRKKDRP